MMVKGVTTISGPNSGKTVSIVGGVHGNEQCGVEAISGLLSEIKLKAGKVHFIYGNPSAIAREVRQIDMNLNRAFRPENELTEKEKQSYERKRALEIMPLLEGGDALLDLHASQSKKSTPFIICEPHSFELARRLSFPIISCGWDKLEPGGTDHFMNRLGKIGLCIECGYQQNQMSTVKAKQAVLDFLGLMGLIENRTPPQLENKSKIIRVYFIYRTKKNFSPAREFADFERLKNDVIVGRDGIKKILAPANDYIVFCRRREKSGEEAFLLGKDYVEN